ncbi:hypothetical protein [Burkholderia cenocepacia]|uniref:hypothetical protein n=1 Tax=Burkholderia cenocepacia TaxID=95486 RepID=UPI000D886CAE|nr:hypothetical protein [Burkholderia cenocepacia]SPV14114.1 Uncharacterised protein [Burkholderia cenocepacia]
MTPHPALSTPRPLPRKREHAKKRPATALASVNGTSTQSDCSGLTPAKAIQRDKAPHTRRKSIQTNEALADTRQGRRTQLDDLRIKIYSLVTNVSHSAAIAPLDLMTDATTSQSSNTEEN